MRCAVFNTKRYDRDFLGAEAVRVGGHELVFLEPLLTAETAPLAHGFPAICAFVNDRLDAPVLEALAAGGTKLIALRCAGFNNVDLPAAAGVLAGAGAHPAKTTGKDIVLAVDLVAVGIAAIGNHRDVPGNICV